MSTENMIADVTAKLEKVMDTVSDMVGLSDSVATEDTDNV